MINIKTKERNYCEHAEYIDERYICKVSGEPCDLGFFPSRYECYRYVKYHERRRRNTTNKNRGEEK